MTFVSAMVQILCHEPVTGKIDILMLQILLRMHHVNILQCRSISLSWKVDREMQL